eukprot:3745335-Rhodomonas_salina.2
MRDYAEDSNWLRLWAANGNDDRDNFTQTVTHPAQLSDSTAAAPRVLHIGLFPIIGPLRFSMCVAVVELEMCGASLLCGSHLCCGWPAQLS